MSDGPKLTGEAELGAGGAGAEPGSIDAAETASASSDSLESGPVTTGQAGAAEVPVGEAETVDAGSVAEGEAETSDGSIAEAEASEIPVAEGDSFDAGDASSEASQVPAADAGTLDAGGVAADDLSDINFGAAPAPEDEPLGGDLRPEDLLDLRLNVWAELGRTELPAAEVVGLPRGAILDLDRLPDDPADVFVNGTLLGRGRLIELDGEWAVRIESLELPRDQVEHASSDPSAG